PGNQDPETPWPSSLVLLSAIAAVTARIRLVAGAGIAPPRPPPLPAPGPGPPGPLPARTAGGAPPGAPPGPGDGARGGPCRGGAAAWAVRGRDTPASFAGEHYSFRDVYFEPKAYRPRGPALWLGGTGLHRRMLARIVAHGDGFNPLGRPAPAELAALMAAMRAA